MCLHMWCYEAIQYCVTWNNLWWLANVAVRQLQCAYISSMVTLDNLFPAGMIMSSKLKYLFPSKYPIIANGYTIITFKLLQYKYYIHTYTPYSSQTASDDIPIQLYMTKNLIFQYNYIISCTSPLSHMVHTVHCPAYDPLSHTSYTADDGGVVED